MSEDEIPGEHGSMCFDFESSFDDQPSTSDAPRGSIEGDSTTPQDVPTASDGPESESKIQGYSQVEEVIEHHEEKDLNDAEDHEAMTGQQINDAQSGRDMEVFDDEDADGSTFEPEHETGTSAVNPATRQGEKLEIILHEMPDHLRKEYKVVKSDIVDKVLKRIKSAPGEKWYEVEFEDGRVDQVSKFYFYPTITSYSRQSGVPLAIRYVLPLEPIPLTPSSRCGLKQLKYHFYPFPI